MRAPSPPGFYRTNARWLAAGVLLTFCSSFGQTFFIALFAAEIRAAHGLSDGQWGGLYTAATLLSAAVLFQVGGLADRVALGRLASATAIGVALAAAAMALGASVAGLFVALFALRLAGQGMLGHIAMTAMGRWFRAHRGRAVAVAGLGYSLGEALLPALALGLAAGIGWRGTWASAAALALLAAAALAMLMARGRAPQGGVPVEDVPGLRGRHWTRPEVLRHGVFWAILPIALTPSFIGTVVFFQQAHVAEVKGWSLAAMAPGFPAYAAATVAAALAGGALVDRIGPLRLLPAFLLPFAAGTALIGIAAAPAGWILALGLLGVTQGLAQTLWGALWPELYGTRNLGAVRSAATTAMVFATAAGPGLTGLLIDAGLSFPAQTGALALWCLVAAAIGLGVGRALAVRAPAG